MTDDAPVTAAGWEEKAHPRGEHGKFRRLDEIMGDLRKAVNNSENSRVTDLSAALNAAHSGKRAEARNRLDAVAHQSDSPEVKSLVAEAKDRLKPLKVGKGRETPNGYGGQGKNNVVHDVTHPDHGHIGTVQKTHEFHGVHSGRIRTGFTQRTVYRADPNAKPGAARTGDPRYDPGVKEFRTRAEAEHHLAEHADAKAAAAAPSGTGAATPGSSDDMFHSNTPGGIPKPMGNQRPDPRQIAKGWLVPDHQNSNHSGSLFDSNGNRFYRAQSGKVMADRPHPDVPAPNARKLDFATPEEQDAFERTSARMGGNTQLPPEVSRAQEVAGERRDVAKANADSIAGENLPVGYGLMETRTGDNHPVGGVNKGGTGTVHVAVHNVHGMIGPERRTRAEAINDVKVHAAARMKSSADALRKPESSAAPVKAPVAEHIKTLGDLRVAVVNRGGRGKGDAATHLSNITNRDNLPRGGADLPVDEAWGRLTPEQGETVRKALSPDDRAARQDSSIKGKGAKGLGAQVTFRQPGGTHRSGKVVQVDGQHRIVESPSEHGLGTERHRVHASQISPAGDGIEAPSAPRSTNAQTVRLQGYGAHPASPVRDVKPGDTVIYNHGEKATVVRNEPSDRWPGKHHLTVRSASGHESTSTKNSSTLIAHVPAGTTGGPPSLTERIDRSASAAGPTMNAPDPSSGAPGRSAKMQRAFQAASEGDHGWLASHGFDAQPGDSIHVHDDRGIMAFGRKPSRNLAGPDEPYEYSMQSVNGNGRAAGQSQAGISALPEGFRKVHEPRPGGAAPQPPKSGPLTDEPGKITKLTGPRSVHSPGPDMLRNPINPSDDGANVPGSPLQSALIAEAAESAASGNMHRVAQIQRRIGVSDAEMEELIAAYHGGAAPQPASAVPAASAPPVSQSKQADYLDNAKNFGEADSGLATILGTQESKGGAGTGPIRSARNQFLVERQSPGQGDMGVAASHLDDAYQQMSGKADTMKNSTEATQMRARAEAVRRLAQRLRTGDLVTAGTGTETRNVGGVYEQHPKA